VEERRLQRRANRVVLENAGLQGPLFHGGSSRKALFTRTGISETPDLPETIQSALSASNYRKT
jgi:hypothetical protein